MLFDLVYTVHGNTIYWCDVLFIYWPLLRACRGFLWSTLSPGGDQVFMLPNHDTTNTIKLPIVAAVNAISIWHENIQYRLFIEGSQSISATTYEAGVSICGQSWEVRAKWSLFCSTTSQSETVLILSGLRYFVLWGLVN